MGRGESAAAGRVAPLTKQAIDVMPEASREGGMPNSSGCLRVMLAQSDDCQGLKLGRWGLGLTRRSRHRWTSAASDLAISFARTVNQRVTSLSRGGLQSPPGSKREASSAGVDGPRDSSFGGRDRLLQAQSSTLNEGPAIGTTLPARPALGRSSIPYYLNNIFHFFFFFIASASSSRKSIIWISLSLSISSAHFHSLPLPIPLSGSGHTTTSYPSLFYFRFHSSPVFSGSFIFSLLSSSRSSNEILIYCVFIFRIHATTIFPRFFCYAFSPLTCTPLRKVSTFELYCRSLHHCFFNLLSSRKYAPRYFSHFLPLYEKRNACTATAIPRGCGAVTRAELCRRSRDCAGDRPGTGPRGAAVRARLPLPFVSRFFLFLFFVLRTRHTTRSSAFPS